MMKKPKTIKYLKCEHDEIAEYKKKSKSKRRKVAPYKISNAFKNQT